MESLSLSGGAGINLGGWKNEVSGCVVSEWFWRRKSTICRGDATCQITVDTFVTFCRTCGLLLMSCSGSVRVRWPFPDEIGISTLGGMSACLAGVIAG